MNTTNPPTRYFPSAHCTIATESYTSCTPFVPHVEHNPFQPCRSLCCLSLPDTLTLHPKQTTPALLPTIPPNPPPPEPSSPDSPNIVIVHHFIYTCPLSPRSDLGPTSSNCLQTHSSHHYNNYAWTISSTPASTNSPVPLLTSSPMPLSNI